MHTTALRGRGNIEKPSEENKQSVQTQGYLGTCEEEEEAGVTCAREESNRRVESGFYPMVVSPF